MAKRLKTSQVRKFSQAKLQEWLADPGKRSRLPDSFLSPEQRKTREANAAKKAAAAADMQELVPDSGLTLGSVKKQLEYESQLNYGDLENQYRNQAFQLASNQNRDNAWFDNYRQSVLDAQKAYDDRAKSFATANQTLFDNARMGSQAQDSAAANQLSQQQSKLNLGGPDLAQQSLGTAANANVSRDTAVAAMTAAMNDRARTGSDQFTAMALGAGANKADSLNRFNAANAELGSKNEQLAKNKAAFLQKMYDKALSDAQERVLQYKVYQATVDKNKSAEEIAKERLAIQKAQLAWQQQYQGGMLGVAQQNANTSASKASSSGKDKSKPPRASSSDIQNFTTDVGRMLSNSGSFSASRLLKKTGNDYGRVRNILISQKRLNPTLVDSVLDQVRFGGISPTNRKRLRALGFKIADFPQFGSKPKRGPNKGK